MTSSSTIRHSRDAIKSELAHQEGNGFKYSVNEEKIKVIESKSETINIHLKAKHYNYTSIYGYLIDVICAFCTDYRKDKKAIGKLDMYYQLYLKRSTLERYAFGKYTKVRSRFWDNLYDVLKTPRTLVMRTEEGNYYGEPIRLLLGEPKLRKNTEKMLTIRIDFFKPMFRSLIETESNWIPIPRYLQAIIDTMLIENPELGKYYVDNEERKLTSREMRSYFLYTQDHSLNKNSSLKIDAIEFWLCVRPENVRKEKLKTGNIEHYITNKSSAKKELEALIDFHSALDKKINNKDIKYQLEESTNGDKEYVIVKNKSIL